MLVLTNTAGASATTPPASKTTLFVDASGVPSTKNNGGTVTPLLTGPAAAAAYQPLDADLTGIAGLTYTADLSPYYNGTAWATYTVTSVGRTLLAATTQAAQRTAIQAVGTVGNETIAGAKTCTTAWRWDIGTFGSIQFANPLDQIGFIFRFGDPAGGDAAMYRNDFRFSQGQMNLFVNPVAGTSAGTQGLQVTTTTVGPQVTNAMSCGSSGRVWTQVFATNTTISASDARLKTEPRKQSDAERKVGSALAREPMIWEWLTGDRLHAGPTVQAAIAVMKAHGLDPFAYSFICYDEWEAEPEQWHEWPAEEAVYEEVPDSIYGENGTVLAVHRTKRVLVKEAVEAGRELVQAAREAGNRYSFRKEELLCFMVSALAAENDLQAAKVAALDARLAALEAKD